MKTRAVGIIYNPNREITHDWALKVSDWLAEREYQVFINSNGGTPTDKIFLEDSTLSEESGKRVELAVVLGGDGTLLGAARLLAPFNVPMLGVNMGHLGFLTQLHVDHLYKMLESVLQGEYSIEERMMLTAQVYRQGKLEIETAALNDFVISKVALARIIELETYVDNHYVTNYLADGLIIATPTGSTAYAMSAGGPILTPAVEGIVLAPICPFSLSTRPLVVSHSQVIRATLVATPSAAEEVMLTVDGQVGHSLQVGDEMIFRRASHNARFITTGGSLFFNTLRAKLNWGSKNVK